MIVWNTFENDARVLKEAQTLANAGHEVTIFALHEPGRTQKYETIERGIHVRRVGRFTRFWKKKSGKPGGQAQGPVSQSKVNFIFKLVSRILMHLNLLARMIWQRSDVVHSHDVNTLITAYIAARLTGAKIVYDAHEVSTSREGYSALKGFVYRVESMLMPRVDAVITTTRIRAQFLARVYKVTQPVVLQNRPRHNELRSSNRLREELNLAEPWPIFVYQGGLQQGRGLRKLVSAASKVKDIYLILIGGGRQTKALSDLIADSQSGDRIKIIPTVPLRDLHSYTCSADVGVQVIRNTCFNHWSTDSNKLFEYIQAGLPVIATDFPEIREVVTQHNVGLLTPAEGEDVLVAAFETLRDDPDLRATLAQNAVACAGVMNWEEQEAKLAQLYNDLDSPKAA